MNPRLRTTLWLVAVVAVVMGCFWRVWLCGYSFVPTDIVHELLLPFGAAVKNPVVRNHFAMDAVGVDYPWAVYWQQTVRAGHLPLWNPQILGGQPTLADSWTAVLSPFKLLLLGLPAERAFSLGILLQLVLAAAFMFALLRELGRSDGASFLGAVAYGLNSCFLMWYWRVPATFVWAPLVIWLFERGCRRRTWGWSLAAGLVLGIALLCGSIQQSFHIGFLAAAYCACTLWLSPAEQRRWVLSQSLIILVGAVMLAAVQLGPTLELMMLDAHRSTQTRGTHAGFWHSLLGPFFLSTFAFPQISGTNESYDLLKVIGATRGDFNGSIGLLPFALAVAGLWRNRDRRARTCLWLIVAVIVIVFGTPLIKFVYHRFFVVAIFAAAILAAFGFDRALDLATEHRQATHRILSTGLFVCLGVACLLLVTQSILDWRGAAVHQKAWAYIQPRIPAYAFSYKTEWFRQRLDVFLEHYRLTNPVWWVPLAGLSLVVIVWRRYAAGKLSRTLITGMFAIVTVIDLGCYARQVVPQINLARYPLRPMHAGLAPILNDSSLFRISHLGTNYFYVLHPNLSMLYDIQDAHGNSSLAPADVAQLSPKNNLPVSRLLDLENVKYLLAEPDEPAPADRFELLSNIDGLSVYRNRTCLPRAQWITRYRVLPDQAHVRAALDEPDFDASQTVLLETEPPAMTRAESPGSSAVAITHYSPLRVTAEVTAATPGFLLLADTWYPGWRATIDGKPAPLLRADYCLRAVPVPAGQRQVEFVFDSATIRWGGVVSGITLFGFVTGLIVAGRRPCIYNAASSR